jgi:hypothetical protein
MDLGQIDEDDADVQESPVKKRKTDLAQRRVLGEIDDVSIKSQEHKSPTKGAINMQYSDNERFLEDGDLVLKP